MGKAPMPARSIRARSASLSAPLIPLRSDHSPNATLVGNFFLVERLGLEIDLPLHRIRSVDHGESFDAGDRTLHLFRPPVFDGPTTRGLYDPTTATMWIVDSFGCDSS